VFSPPGYLPLSTLRRNVPWPFWNTVTDDILDMLIAIERRSTGPERAIRLSNNVSLADFFEQSYFLKPIGDDVFLASPRGEIVRFDLTAIIESYRLAGIPCFSAEWGGASLPRSFSGLYRLNDMTGNDFILVCPLKSGPP